MLMGSDSNDGGALCVLELPVGSKDVQGKDVGECERELLGKSAEYKQRIVTPAQLAVQTFRVSLRAARLP